MTEHAEVEERAAQSVPGERLQHWASTCPIIESEWVIGLQVTIFLRDTKLAVAGWELEADAHTSDIDASLRVRGWRRARPWEAGDGHGLVSWVLPDADVAESFRGPADAR